MIREIELLLRGLEEGGLVKWNRDSQGRAIGIRFDETLGGSITPTGHLTTKVIRGGQPPDEIK